MVISKKISQISPSPTLSITARAKKRQAEGINVIGFGAGEPDFDTPVNIEEAAKKAIDKGFTKYTPTAGTKELSRIITKAGIYCISDEIYEKVIYGQQHVSIASFGEDIKKKTIVVNGVSKAYSMTGWRIGYAAGRILLLGRYIRYFTKER